MNFVRIKYNMVYNTQLFHTSVSTQIQASVNLDIRVHGQMNNKNLELREHINIILTTSSFGTINIVYIFITSHWIAASVYVY